MSALLQSRVLTVALLAVCVGLGAGVLDSLDERRSPAATAPARVAIAKPRAAAKADPTSGFAGLPDINTLTETVERPLFEQSRRPPSEPEVANEGPPVPLHVFLSGIVIADGKRYAHIRSDNDARVRVLSEGDAVDRWRIQSILPDRVVLSSGDRTEEILLKDKEPERAAPPRRRAGPRQRDRRR